MNHVKKIVVSILLDKKEVGVGELVTDDKRIYFKYYISFIKKGINISPLKLKLTEAIQAADDSPFNGLFGVFADSLPDGWGRLLLDKTLLAKGIALDEVTMLDRLAYVGSNGMGALIYRPQMEPDTHKPFPIELAQIANDVTKIISGTTTKIINKLYRLEGSSGGARPKITVAYNPTTNELIGPVKVLPKNYEHWLIKFSSSTDKQDAANVEYAYYKMAADAGIEMSQSKLFKGQYGRTYFGTKRFDRAGNKRLHLHSAAGIMHDNFRLSTMDYGHLMDCAFRLEGHVRAYEKILRIAAFNVFAHNKDDHSKNFSFLMDARGKWSVAPAYDLTFSGAAHGFHSTAIYGESKNPTKEHLLKLANYFQVKNAGKLINEVQAVVLNWKKYAARCGVSRTSANEISAQIGVKK